MQSVGEENHAYNVYRIVWCKMGVVSAPLSVAIP